MNDKSTSPSHKSEWLTPELARMSIEETLGGIVMNYSESQEFHLTTGGTLNGADS